ncbi:MAG: MaoC family dehydratase [Oscillochloris sp.]|nr:MaoC family dehydratase [Oscillochloris sp.]
MQDSPFSTPRDQRYFDDYVAGSVHNFGPITVSEDEVIAFARRYDPQDFHTDPELARESIYGGLIASGWHTAAMMMRLLVDEYLSSVASLGSPGIDDLRWLQPVRPGDLLSVRVFILEARRSQSRPDRGVVRSAIEVCNQDGTVVMTMNAVNFFLTRDPQSDSINS